MLPQRLGFQLECGHLWNFTTSCSSRSALTELANARTNSKRMTGPETAGACAMRRAEEDDQQRQHLHVEQCSGARSLSPSRTVGLNFNPPDDPPARISELLDSWTWDLIEFFLGENEQTSRSASVAQEQVRRPESRSADFFDLFDLDCCTISCNISLKTFFTSLEAFF